MTTDALKVVYAKDSSHMLISCNRLLGKQPSPECTWTTTTTSTTTTSTTTTTTTSTTTSTTTLNSEAIINEESRQSEDSFIGEIIGGVISGILAIVAIILLILFLKQRQKQSDVETADLHHKKDIQEEKIPLEDSQAQKVSLLPSSNAANNTTATSEAATQDQFEEDEDESRPKFASPIWLEEIHNNKIFNRQKSLLSEDKLKEIAEQDLPLPPPPPLPEASEEEQERFLMNGDFHDESSVQSHHEENIDEI